MLSLRQLLQLPQNLLNHTYSGAVGELVFHFRGVGIPQPFPQLTFAKSPLPAYLDRWNFPALRPQTHRPGRDTKPLRDRCGGEK
jgi:hypothetical protein